MNYYVIYHRTAVWGRPALPKKPNELGWPRDYTPIAVITAVSLEDAYRNSQNDDCVWTEWDDVLCLFSSVEARSTSIGDVIWELPGGDRPIRKPFAVALMGFQPLD